MDQELQLLRTFYVEVARLTVEHQVSFGSAYVSPIDLGRALDKVNVDWQELLRTQKTDG